MREVTYYCNLCREKVPKEELRVLYWVSAVIPQRYELKKVSESGDCDKHICMACIEVVKNHVLI